MASYIRIGIVQLGRRRVLPEDRAGAAMNDTSLHGAGSTFSAALYKQWIETYHREHPQVSITYDAVGSGEGVRRFVAGSVDFGASDVALSDREAAEISRGAVMVASTAGMVVLAYNVPGLRGELKLPRDVYPAILSGQIRRWDDPRIQAANPGVSLPHLNIVIVARQDSSGTTFALTNHLAAISLAWREQGLGVGKLVEWPASAMLASGNEGVAARIKISEGSIGYVEYGFAKRLGLPMAVLQNKAGKFVSPDDSCRPTISRGSLRKDADGIEPVDRRSLRGRRLSDRHLQLAAALSEIRRSAERIGRTRFCCVGLVGRADFQSEIRLSAATRRGRRIGDAGSGKHRPIATA